MRRLVALLFLCSCHGPAPALTIPAPAVSARPEPIPLGPLPRDVHPRRQSIALEIDPGAERFAGQTALELTLDRPRDVIWLHGRGLAVSAATVTTAAGARLEARWEEVDPIGVARLSLPGPVVGAVTVNLAFSAAYDPQLTGVYRVKTAAGPAVFSKFEAIYARRAFPGFDEPAFKIPFALTLTVPAAAVVVANTPPADQQPVAGDRKRVRFAPTGPLPTYLVAFAVGPFEARGATIAASDLRPAPLPLGVVALAGRARDATYALDQEPAILSEQERYFGVPFPYPKLDLIAVPDFQSGAMENAGAITFRDSFLLVDEATASTGQRRAVASVLAHETAHQWFGDLVTMGWWNDLWLNEGFATFLATRTLRAVRPDLEAELSAVDAANTVMNNDSLATARRIRQPIETAHDITNAFDNITYQKGAAFLTMLEHFLGAQVFRRGVHQYLAGHAGGNATTGDLVAALSTEAGMDLRALTASFLDQPGVPAISARIACPGSGKGRVELTQGRWRPVGSTLPAGGQTWTVPVCVRAGFGERIEEACTLLGQRTGALELSACPDWVMPNAGAAGYYRFDLPTDDLGRLRDHGTQRLTVAERLSLGHNLEAAFRSEALPAAEVLTALERLASDEHGGVASLPLGLFAFIEEVMLDPRAQVFLREHLARLYAPAMASLGWTPSATETPSRRLFRTRLLAFLALELESPPVLATAGRLGRRWLGLEADHTPHPDAAAPDLAGVVLSAAARRGGDDVLDALIAQLMQSQDAAMRGRLMEAMGSVRSPALVQRVLDFSLEPRLRQNERLNPLAPLLGAAPTRDAAWAWLKEHFDALAALLPDRYAGRLPSMMLLCDRQRADDVRAFFTPRVGKLSGGPRLLAQALEASDQCVARVSAQRASVDEYVRGLASRK